MTWRRLRVRGNTSLADLYHIIQIAMGWDNDHLHCFHIYGEESLLFGYYGISYDGGMSFTHNARQVFLDNFGFDVGDRFTSTYNFTTYWANAERNHQGKGNILLFPSPTTSDVV